MKRQSFTPQEPLWTPWEGTRGRRVQGRTWLAVSAEGKYAASSSVPAKKKLVGVAVPVAEVVVGDPHVRRGPRLGRGRGGVGGDQGAVDVEAEARRWRGRRPPGARSVVVRPRRGPSSPRWRRRRSTPARSWPGRRGGRRCSEEPVWPLPNPISLPPAASWSCGTRHQGEAPWHPVGRPGEARDPLRPVEGHGAPGVVDAGSVRGGRPSGRAVDAVAGVARAVGRGGRRGRRLVHPVPEVGLEGRHGARAGGGRAGGQGDRGRRSGC